MPPRLRSKTTVYLSTDLHRELKIVAAMASRPGDQVDVNELLVLGARLVIATIRGKTDASAERRLEELRSRVVTAAATLGV